MTTDDIISKLIGFGVPAGDARILAAVAGAESGYRTDAAGDYMLNKKLVGRQAAGAAPTSFGLFQIHIPAHYDKLERWTGSSIISVWQDWLKNPENNIFAASQVYKSQGLGAWTTYRTGAYKKYLGKDTDIEGKIFDSDTENSKWIPDFIEKPIDKKIEDTGNFFIKWIIIIIVLAVGFFAALGAFKE